MMPLYCQMPADPRKMLSQIHHFLQIAPTQARAGKFVQPLDRHHPPAKLLPLQEVLTMSGTTGGIYAGHVRVVELRRAGVRRMHRGKNLMAPR